MSKKPLSKRIKILIALAVTFSILLVFFLIIITRPTSYVSKAGSGVVSAENSLIFITSPIPPRVKADGKQAAVITVYLMDSKTEKEDSLGVGGKEVKLVTNLGSVTPQTTISSSDMGTRGQAVFSVVSDQEGDATITAVDTSDGITINKSVMIKFVK